MFNKSARLWLGLIAALAVLSLGSSCSKTPEGGGDDTTSTSGSAYTSKGDEGTITGTVAYAGAAPEAKKIDTSADPQCAAKAANLMSEEWAVKDGKVANTFVYIKDGTLADGKKVGDYTYTATGAPVLDQDGCHYRPHVFGVMTKQEIEIKNSDQTTHNVHFTPKNNPDWNQSQPNGAPALKHKLNVAEAMVPVKCNQHPWMKAYVGVMKHPFFAVSAENGAFSIKGVPPGTYTVVAWHEGPGPGTEKTMQVTVPAKGSATADFSFGASAEMRGQPSSLPMLPAIEFPMLRR